MAGLVLILALWLLLTGCPKELSIKIIIWATLILLGIQIFSSDVGVLLLLMIIVVIIVILICQSGNQSKVNRNEKTTVNPNDIKKEDTIIKTIDDPKEDMQSNEDVILAEEPVLSLRELFENYKSELRHTEKDDPRYAFLLHELGLLYENLHHDLFRATCFCYLATERDKFNKDYEKDYIRLCDLLEKRMGFDYLYRVTLVNDISDIHIQIDNILNEKKVETIVNRKPSPTVKIQPTYHNPVRSKPIKTNSKFDEFDAESYLHSLGYKVGNTGLSVNQRRNLLRKVINEGKVSKYEVEKTLENNIHLFSRRKNMTKAVSDWKMDLIYVRKL